MEKAPAPAITPVRPAKIASTVNTARETAGVAEYASEPLFMKMIKPRVNRGLFLHLELPQTKYKMRRMYTMWANGRKKKQTDLIISILEFVTDQYQDVTGLREKGKRTVIRRHPENISYRHVKFDEIQQTIGENVDYKNIRVALYKLFENNHLIYLKDESESDPYQMVVKGTYDGEIAFAEGYYEDILIRYTHDIIDMFLRWFIPLLAIIFTCTYTLYSGCQTSNEISDIKEELYRVSHQPQQVLNKHTEPQ